MYCRTVRLQVEQPPVATRQQTPELTPCPEPVSRCCTLSCFVYFVICATIDVQAFLSAVPFFVAGKSCLVRILSKP